MLTENYLNTVSRVTAIKRLYNDGYMTYKDFIPNDINFIADSGILISK